jgi:plastocyanin domain-containing protein
MNKTASIIITLGLIVAIGIVFWGGKENSESVQNVEIKNGVQYITIDAKGGYSPRLSTAKAGIPTKLVVKTDGTYDCSSSLVVRAVGFQKFLPQTGETEIDLGIPKAGVPIEGVCGMGMYSFNVNFQN